MNPPKPPERLWHHRHPSHLNRVDRLRSCRKRALSPLRRGKRRQTMATFETITFSDTKVELDGNTFTDCVIRNSTLVYRGGELPNFIRCSFHAPILLGFEDSAGRTIRLLRSMYAGGMKELAETAIQAIQSGTPKPTVIH